jgi:hypothetical protein
MDDIPCTAFVNLDRLSPKQLVDLNDATSAMKAFWAAVRANPRWQSEGESPLNRCILSALCLRDILHACGRRDALMYRTGLDVRLLSGDVPHTLTIGMPSAPRLRGKWNAHMGVLAGDFLLDPTLGQTKRWWNRSPLCAVFLIGAPDGHTIDIDRDREAPSTTVHRYSQDGHDFQVSYFKLPLASDLRTKKWQSQPDARPERRKELVREAVNIRMSQFSHTMLEAA